MIDPRRLTPQKLVIYLLVFFSVWSVRELVIRPVFLNSLDGLAFQFVESAIKLLVWTVPALLLIKYYESDMWISRNEMFTTKPKWFTDAPILLVIFAPLLRTLFLTGGLTICPDFQPLTLIGAVLFVGITEEVVFRGFLLNALLKKLKLWPAIAVNEILFVLIHFPIWIYAGHDFRTFLSSIVAVFFLGGLFSFSFVKTRSIFVPIALHMIWNLLVTLFAV